MTTLLTRLARRATSAHVQHVTPVPAGAARGLVAEVYRQVERDFGILAPPVTLHSPEPTVLAAGWTLLRETLLVPGPASRAAKEAVAAAVSLANRCPYCVDVHGSVLAGLLRDEDARAVMTDDLAAVRDRYLRRLVAWARDPAGAGVRLTAPPAETVQLVGVAVAFHYLNRMVNVFLVDSPLPPTPAAARRVVAAVASGLGRWLAARRPERGAALPLLPDAPLPPDLAWAAGDGTVATALARAAAAIDAAGRVVPEPVRRLVQDNLDAPAPGIGSRRWLDQVVEPLAPDERPAARLALLTAVASYQVGPGLVRDVRDRGWDDAALVSLTAWAGFAAARRIGGRLAAGMPTAVAVPPPAGTVDRPYRPAG